MKWVALMCIPLYIFIVHYPNVQLDLDAVIKLWQPHRFTKPATGHWNHFILHFALVMVFLVFKFFIFIFQNSNCDLKLSLSLPLCVCMSFSISLSSLSLLSFAMSALRLSITIFTLFTFIAVGFHIVTNEKYHSKIEHRAHRKKTPKKNKKRNRIILFASFHLIFFFLDGMLIN